VGTIAIATFSLTVEVGGLPTKFTCDDREYTKALERRFEGFVRNAAWPLFEFDLELAEPQTLDPDDEVKVSLNGDRWHIERSDCQAVLDVGSGRGRIRQPPHPYATDTVLRILHSLLLARRGGLLLHASSAIRGGRAFLFFGRSGAGKSTIVGMAPADAIVLSEEISYVRRDGETYVGCGTPFTGELNQRGDNTAAPLARLFHLVQGPEDRIDPLSRGDALRALLQSVLCFPGDTTVTKQVFAAACSLVDQVPVQTLLFRRDPRVWELVT
jgi:hypothetical protein